MIRLVPDIRVRGSALLVVLLSLFFPNEQRMKDRGLAYHDIHEEAIGPCTRHKYDADRLGKRSTTWLDWWSGAVQTQTHEGTGMWWCLAYSKGAEAGGAAASATVRCYARRAKQSKIYVVFSCRVVVRHVCEATRARKAGRAVVVQRLLPCFFFLSSSGHDRSRLHPKRSKPSEEEEPVPHPDARPVPLPPTLLSHCARPRGGNSSLAPCTNPERTCFSQQIDETSPLVVCIPPFVKLVFALGFEGKPRPFDARVRCPFVSLTPYLTPRFAPRLGRLSRR